MKISREVKVVRLVYSNEPNIKWSIKREIDCLRRRKQNVEHDVRRARNLRPLASSRLLWFGSLSPRAMCVRGEFGGDLSHLTTRMCQFKHMSCRY